MNNTLPPGLRVAHLNFIDAAGVTRKLAEMAEAAIELGLPIDFYLISSSFEDHQEGALRFRRRKAPPFDGKFRFLAKLFWSEDLVGRYVDSERYDLFVIRFGKSFLSQGITYRRHGSRIVTEHHTDEIAEILLKPTLARRALAYISLQRSRKALRRTAGAVAVTGEILEIERKKAGQRKPSLVWPNGVRVPELEPPRRELDGGEAVRIVFAAANFQPWQGLDRLLEGTLSYAGARKVELHIAGRLNATQERAVEEAQDRNGIRVIVHGLLDAATLGELYDRCHLGIAGLAFDRIGMQEACPLKIREYAARGIPFVHTHADPDFPEGFPYALKLPGGEVPADFDAMVRFVEELYSAGSPSLPLWTFARDKLDWKPKLRDLYAFLSSLPIPELS